MESGGSGERLAREGRRFGEAVYKHFFALRMWREGVLHWVRLYFHCLLGSLVGSILDISPAKRERECVSESSAIVSSSTAPTRWRKAKLTWPCKPQS